MNVLEAERAIESLSYLKSESRSDYASDEAFANFREVQCGNIKPKKLYRSSSPILCDERSFCAEKLCESCGIKTILNLSDNFESAKVCFNEFAGFNESSFYRNFYKNTENKNVIFLNLDISFYSKRSLKKLREIFSFLADGKEPPILIHCNEGKDRTGFVCRL